MAGCVIFFVSYVFYVLIFVQEKLQPVYPVLIAPAAVFFVAGIYAFLLAKIRGEKKFVREFFRLANWQAVFALLFLTPLLIKMNLPEPHNFMIRKFELILGISYAAYLAAITLVFLKEAFRRADFEKTGEIKIFRFIGVSFFIFYFFISLWMNYANQPTGDEPSYLMTAHSLVYDRDLNLKNNYEVRDYLKFYKKELLPQGTDIKYKGGLYSYHPVLLSVLAAPFYFAAGRFGAVAALNAVAGFLIALIFLFLSGVMKDSKTAAVAAVITGLTMPVIAFVNNISTEIITAAVILAVYYLIKNKIKKTWLISLLAASMVWLHIRCLPIYGSLCLLYVFYNRDRPREAAKFILIQFLSAVVFAGFNYSTYGVIIPSYSMEGSNAARFTPWHMPLGIAAFFMDRQMGLFTYAPVYVFSIAGAVMLYLRHKREFFEGLLVFAPYFIVISSWDDWGAGSAAPRYLVPLIFLFSLSLAAVIKYGTGKKALLLIKGAVILSFAIAVIIMCVPWLRWDRPYSENYMMTLASGAAHFCVNCLFPSFKPGGNTAVTAAVWGIIIAVLNIFVLRGALKNISVLKTDVKNKNSQAHL